MGAAKALVGEVSTVSVPTHLRDAHYPGAAHLGHGDGYRYPHDHPGHVVAQEYFPPELGERTLYEPTDQGAEAEVAERLVETDRQAKRNRHR